MPPMTMDEEIKLIFAENPDLYTRSLEGIARYFMIQGQVRYSLLEASVNNKAKYFMMRLKDSDPESYEKAIKEWNKAASIEDILSAI